MQCKIILMMVAMILLVMTAGSAYGNPYNNEIEDPNSLPDQAFDDFNDPIDFVKRHYIRWR